MTEINQNEINNALTRVLSILEMEEEKHYVTNADIFDQLLTAFSVDLDSVLYPHGVGTDYVGVHLGPKYDDSDFRLLLKSFKNNQKLDALYALKVLNDAKEKLSNYPNIQECLINDPLEMGCIVVGDLHGHFNDLHHIIKKYGIPGAHYKFIFNGDFVDRGPKQMEVLLIILYSFLIRPDRVFINRGNHEDISMNVRSWDKINFMKTVRNMYSRYWTAVFNSSEELFTYFPVATVLNNTITQKKYFIVHGGIADDLDLDYVQHKLDRTKFRRVSPNNVKNEHDVLEAKYFTDLLWSDPITDENKNGCSFNTNRNLGCFFGADVTNDFCERHGYSALIRSHQVRASGYSEDHAKCITVFSASHYCDGHNYGAVLRITPDGLKPKPHKYKTKSGDILDDEYVKTQNLIKRFKKLIQKNEKSLKPLFEKFNETKDGWIYDGDWAMVLSNFFNDEIGINQLGSLKTFLCECDKDKVNYETMFKQKLGDETRVEFYDENTMKVVENLFDILDRNNDKRISVKDAREALNIVSERLGVNKLIHNACEFVKMFGREAEIDLNEFKKKFLEDAEISKSTNEL